MTDSTYLSSCKLLKGYRRLVSDHQQIGLPGNVQEMLFVGAVDLSLGISC